MSSETIRRPIVRHLAARDALGQPLGHGGLAHAGLADEDGVVLRPARENLYHALELRIAAHDGIHAPGGGQKREVAAVLVEYARLRAAGRALDRGPARLRPALPPLARAEEVQHRAGQLSGVGPGALHGPRARAAGLAQDAEQDVLRAHIAVAQPRGLAGGGLERGARGLRQALLRPARLARAAHEHHRARERGHVQPRRGEHPRAQALRLGRHAQQQVLRAHIAVAQRGRRVPGRFERRRGPVRESDAVFHIRAPPLRKFPPLSALAEREHS